MTETNLSNKAQANQKIIAEFVVQAYAPRHRRRGLLLMMKRREKWIDGPRYFLSAERVILDLGLLRKPLMIPFLAIRFSVIPKIFFWLCYTKKDINWSNVHLIINSARHSTASQQMIEGQIFWKLVENGTFQLVAFSGIIHDETSKRNYQNKTKMQTKLAEICVCLHAAVQIICRVCTVQSTAGWYRRPTCTV